ncbi:MAG TPA: PilX N-terminal domain-containing pilus assembly protein [Steroidobacteraceae bacterium]|nr:PilX N-terminal domain-containing pilus assembly protein [Steroidobacteraceae bacterium]
MSAILRRDQQRGMVLITTLLLLIVVTILALGMFHSFGLDEKIAGNLRDKQLALHAAESAQQYAEFWLSNGNVGSSVTCNSMVSYTVGQVCSNPLTNVTAVPWLGGAVPVGVSYTPPTLGVTDTTTMSQQPVYYIANLGSPPSGNGTIYQIDAVGYGGSANTTAIVESTYLVQSSVRDLGGQ